MNNINMLYAIWIVRNFTLFIVIIFKIYILIGNTVCQALTKQWTFFPILVLQTTWAHSFGQFKKHALLKARTQSPCFSYPGLARAFQSAGSADLLSFGGDRVSLIPGAQFKVLQYSIYSRLPVCDRAKMRPVYPLIVALTDFLWLFCIK